MTVYADVLFGLNAAINYLLLRSSAALGGHPVRFWRLLAGACLGGVYAVAGLLPGMGGLQSHGAQVLCAGLMLVLAFGWTRSAVKLGLFFLALSFAFGGAVFLLVQWVEPDCMLLGGRAYYAVSTPALLLLAGVGYAICGFVLNGWGTHTGGEIQSMELQQGEQTLSLRVLRDTGNTLRDPISGQNVLVTEREQLQRLLAMPVEAEALQDPASLLQILTDRDPKLRLCLVPYRAVGTDSGLLLAVRCRLKNGTHTQPVLAAFSPTRLSQDGQFDAIWGGENQ